MTNPKSPLPFGTQDASLQAMGGEAGVAALVEAFYGYMETLPEAATIRAMHPADLALAKEKLTVFLVGWLGGPKRFRERWGPIRIPVFHRKFPIDPAARDAWLLCMGKAADDMPLSDEFRAYFMRQIAVPAGRCLNREAGA